MTQFATLPDAAEPVRLILVGAGGMGRNWLRMLKTAPNVELVGIVDLDLDLARRALAEYEFDGVTVGASVMEIAEATRAQAVINVTVPVAHHPVNTEALFGGLPVLCEKPIAPTVSQALSLAATAEASGQLLMTSQSRRYYDVLTAFRSQVRELGTIGFATTQFFKGPHFGGFRDVMEHPLLIDMAIHAFDVSRYLLEADPVSVYCETFNPSWSWYKGDAAATASFEFAGGARYVFTGSWCSPGLETSWNGSWRVSGSGGSASWDGDNEPVAELTAEDTAGSDAVGTTAAPAPASGGVEIAGSLAEFVSSLRTGVVPSGEVHSNVLSLAMVEAAVLSAGRGERVVIQTILEDAYAAALAAEARPDVRAVLASWGSAAAGLAR